MVTRSHKRKVTRLLRAIQAGDIADVYAALDDGADPNGVDQYEARPLRSAILLTDARARDAITELLLAAGADPDRAPRWPGPRPVFEATDHGYDAVVRMLLAVGGFPRDCSGAPARGSGGSTLLAHACDSGLRWLAERALAEGCRADAVDAHGSTALHHAVRVTGFRPRVGKDTAWFIDWLLDRGAPLEQSRIDAGGAWFGGTALHWAIGRGDEAAVRTLVARGANLEARTPQSQQTPLFAGVLHGSLATVRAALACGADAHAVDAHGRTLLHAAAGGLAIRGADGAMVALLLAAGVDPHARDHNGQTAYARAMVPFSKTHDPPTEAQAQALASLHSDLRAAKR